MIKPNILRDSRLKIFSQALHTTTDMRFRSFQSLHPNCTLFGRATSHIGKR